MLVYIVFSMAWNCLVALHGHREVEKEHGHPTCRLFTTVLPPTLY